MKKYFIPLLSVILASVLTSCSSSKENKEENQVVREAKDIIVTKQDKLVHAKDKVHKNELAKDNKGFYYSLKEQSMQTDTTQKSFTRLDAQKNIKNKNSASLQEKNGSKTSSPYEYIQIDLLKSKLSKNFIIKCSSCHDDYANGIIGPSLLHKDGKFIYETLVAYKTKTKVNVLMRDLVSNMKDKELKELSSEIARFNKQIRELDKDK